MTGLEADEVARHALVGTGRQCTNAAAPAIVRRRIATEAGHGAAHGPRKVTGAPWVLRVASG
eukprot:3529750-Rhodomonas_salina.1